MIKQASLIFLTAFLAGSLDVGPTHADPITLRNTPLLFVDDSGIEERTRTVRTIHSAKRMDAPVLSADQPWEDRRVYLATVDYDSSADLFHMWYLARIPPYQQTQMLYATSKDGHHWEKPSLGLYAVEGSKQNNVLDFVGDGGGEASVLVDPFEKDSKQKYKLLVHNRIGYSLGYSSDGIHWKEYPGNPVFDSGDTAKLAQNSQTGEYLAYYKMPATVRGFDRRVVWLSRSMDFKTWSEPEIVFTSDEVDDDWATKPDERTEVYLMSVFPHAAGFIGLPAMFYHMPQALDGSKTANGGVLSRQGGAVPPTGPMDVHLISSVDGRNWRRTYPRTPVVHRGPPGTYDGGAIYNTDSTPVHVGKETWIYYTAINAGHGAPIPPKTITIGLAKWRLHGYASLDTGPEGGRVETKPIQFTSPGLLVNADAKRGELKVALLEADGSPIKGYSLDDCDVLKADETGWLARWNGATSIPKDRPIKVVIETFNTRLYSLECAANQN